MTRYVNGGRALILGGSCELAIGLAAQMVTSGLHPILTYRNNDGKARIDESLRGTEDAYSCFSLDLSRPPEGLAMMDQMLDQGLHYLVDFAQGDLEGMVAAADMGAIASYFTANIIHRTQVIQKISRTMIAQRMGRMIYVSSAAAGRPNPGQGFYSAAKQAAEALYRNVGLELAPRGVTTATLRPGYVDAGRGRRYLKKNDRAALAKVPLGRALEIDEVVDAIMFLLSNGAVGFNATEITMDGGLSAGKSSEDAISFVAKSSR